MHPKETSLKKGIVAVQKLPCKEMCGCMKAFRRLFDRNITDSISDSGSDRKQHIPHSNQTSF